MENYKDMSDFEINKRVFPYTRDFGKCEDVMQKENPKRSGFMWGDGANWFEFNPCNNPSDAWPIIVENNISINHNIAYYQVNALVYNVKFDGGFKIFRHESKSGDTSSNGALRAAMICFLKMKDAEKQ